MSIQLVYLRQYTIRAQMLIVLGQELADSRRDSEFTISHLCKVVHGFIIADETMSKTDTKPDRYINKKLAAKFLELYEEEYEDLRLEKLPKTNKPNDSYVSRAMLRLMTFAEDQKEVTMNVLMTELLLILRDKKNVGR